MAFIIAHWLEDSLKLVLLHFKALKFIVLSEYFAPAMGVLYQI